MTTLRQLFEIRYGDRAYTDKGVLDTGKVPLIASQSVKNGVYGFFDVPTRYHLPVITVPRTGSIGYAFVQLLPCTPTDDCMVLIPKSDVTVEYLFYVAAIIRSSRWRFNYARKITPARLGKIEVVSYEEFKSTASYPEMAARLYPKPSATTSIEPPEVPMSCFRITDLFALQRGHFHAIDRLEKGKLPTVSRVSDNNGVVGFYAKPARAKVLPRLTLTVSTVTGDTFMQYSPFIATDNVVILNPKSPMKVTTLLYVQVLLNKVKWRYSYGRQCYKGNFERTVIFLPIAGDGRPNEAYIESIVTNRPYWEEYSNRLINQN